MEQELFKGFTDGVLQILKDADLIFMALFVLWSYIINKMASSAKKFAWMNWFTKVPKTLRVFVLGVLMAFLYGWLTEKGTKEGVTSLFYSITITMIAYNMFLGRIVDFLENKAKKE